MKRGVSLLFIAALIGLTGCQKVSYSRVRTTVTIESEGKTYTGSSVQEFICRDREWITTPGCDTEGEAVLVDIPDHGYLFLIMNLHGGYENSQYAASILNSVTSNIFTATNENLPRNWTLAPEDVPMMVKFGDLNDPCSVQEVDPKNMAVELGQGVKLSNVSVETTSDDVTWGKIEAILPWIKEKKSHFYGCNSGIPLTKVISDYDFVSFHRIKRS